MRWFRRAAYSLIAVVTVLVVLVIVAVNLDPQWYKGYVEERVSEALGRKFVIGGKIDQSVGRHIRLLVEDVYVAGADWDNVDGLVRISHLDVSIRTWSLLQGPVMIEYLTLDNVQLNLESADDGRRNWDLFADAEAPSANQVEVLDKLPVMVNQAAVRQFVVTHSAPAIEQPLRIVIDDANLQSPASRDIQLLLNGRVNDTPIKLVATAGPTQNLVELSDMAIDLKGNIGEVALQANLLVDDLLLPQRPAGRVRIQGPNAQYLTGVFGIAPVTTGPLDFSASLSPGDNDLIVLALEGIFGEFNVEAGGSFVDLQKLDEFDIEARASGPDAGAVGRLFGHDSVPRDPFQVTLSANVAGSSVALDEFSIDIGDTRIDAKGRFDSFPSPDGASLELHVGGPDFGRFNRLLGLPGNLTGPFGLDATISPEPDGQAALKLNATSQDIVFSIDGVLAHHPELVGSSLEMQGNGDNFAIVAQALGLTPAPTAEFDLRVRAERTSTGIALNDGVIVIGKDRLEIAGLIGNEPLKRHTDLRFVLSAPDLAATLISFGKNAEGLPRDEFIASGRVFRDNEYFILEELTAALGRDYELSAEGRISDQPDFTQSGGRITLTAARLRPLAALAGVSGMPDSPLRVSAEVERVAAGFSIRKGQLRLGQDTFDIDGTLGEQPLEDNTDVRIRVAAADLRASLQTFGLSSASVPPDSLQASGRIRVRDATILVDGASASLAGAELTASGQLGTLPGFDGTEIDLNIRGDRLSRLVPGAVAYVEANEPYGLRCQVRLMQSTLSLESLEARLGQAKLTGSVTARLAPMLANGSFSVRAEAPRLDHLVPRYADYVSASPLMLATTGSWDGNFLYIDEYLLALGKDRLAVNGVLDRPPGFDKTNLLIDLHIDDVNYLSPLFARPLPADSADLKAHLIGARDKISLTEIDVRLGASDIQGELEYRDDAVPNVALRLDSERLDLRGYLPAPGDEAQVSTSAATTRVLPDRPIDLGPLQKMNADVDIRIRELLIPQQAISDVLLAGSLNGGTLRIDDFNLAGANGGSLSGTFVLQPVNGLARLTMRLSGRQLNLGLPAATAEELRGLPRYDLDTVLSGTGSSIADLAGSLNGFVRIVSGPGRVRASAMRMFTQDFVSQVFDTINPFARQSPYSEVRCAALLVKATGGRLLGQPALVVQTDMLNVFAKADVDLKTEKLGVELNTVPQKGIGIGLSNLVTPYVRVGGTLASPTLELNAEGALLEGGAAVATAGISFFAKRFSDRYLSAKDACGKAVADTADEFEKLAKQHSSP